AGLTTAGRIGRWCPGAARGRCRRRTAPYSRSGSVPPAVRNRHRRERMPVASLVEREIMRLTEQEREADRLVGAHGVNSGIDCERRVAASTAVLARVQTPPMPPIWTLRPFQVMVRK